MDRSVSNSPPVDRASPCTFEQLTRAGAFLATHMNGAPLPLDHGAPVRLFVPGWYGCACIKWVNEIRLVGENEPATSQMQEFAARIHQKGVPVLARDYRPATLDQSAMPLRIEKWRLVRDSGLIYRVVGISWGGDRASDRLTLRFNANEPLAPVKVCPPQKTPPGRCGRTSGVRERRPPTRFGCASTMRGLRSTGWTLDSTIARSPSPRFDSAYIAVPSFTSAARHARSMRFCNAPASGWRPCAASAA
jgi:hypothetical protein